MDEGTSISAIPRDGLLVLHQVLLLLMAYFYAYPRRTTLYAFFSDCAHGVLKELVSMWLANEVLSCSHYSVSLLYFFIKSKIYLILLN
jgi:hypothetical protein